MNKSATLIVSALMTLGLAAGATAAEMPKTATTMAADAPATATTVSDTQKPAKKHKKHKKGAPAPSTTK